MSAWTSEKIARLPDASPEDVREIAEYVLALEAKCERLEWLWAQAENLDPDLVEGAERAWAALEGREP